MTTLLIVRHGQSEANLADIYGGDKPLTHLGLLQGELACAYLAKTYSVSAVYASTLYRSQQTVLPLSRALGLPMHILEGLSEIHTGLWECKTYRELEQQFPEDRGLYLRDIGRSRCTGGESVVEMANRNAAAFDRIVRENPGKTVVVGCHATPMRALHCRLLGYPVEDMRLVPWPNNASLTVVGVENGQYTLIAKDIDDYLGELKTALPGNA